MQKDAQYNFLPVIYLKYCWQKGEVYYAERNESEIQAVPTGADYDWKKQMKRHYITMSEIMESLAEYDITA